MKYYYLEPEVAGGFGSETNLIPGPSRPTVTALHYVFDGWLGDEILESTPCFIVTERLAALIKSHDLTGANTAAVRIDRSEQFTDLHPNTELPPFVWLKIHGEPGVDDFSMTDNGTLVVSERAWNVLRPFASQADVSDYS